MGPRLLRSEFVKARDFYFQIFVTVSKMEEEIIKEIEEKFTFVLKDFQRASYRKVLSGDDVFIVAPTGAGKTLCFALLTEVFDLQQRKMVGAAVVGEDENDSENKDSIVLVISPLSGLLVEQTERLLSYGINAAFIGELQKDESVRQAVLDANVAVLFITPEAILHSKWRAILSSERYNKRIRAVVIDEAHCISHW